MNKDRRRMWWTLFLLAASGIAILIGYYVGMDKDTEKDVLEKEKQIQQQTTEMDPGIDESLPETDKTTEKVRIGIEGSKPTKDVYSQDYCADIEVQVIEFFQYLDTKDYTKQSGENINSYERFKLILKRLSKNPPQPTGEGLDLRIMNKNIFYLYRMLDGVDIMIIKEALRNESDTLETNMELLYTWLMLGDRCPDNENIRPAQDVIYKYAGFFLNTIGGRAYLFRRPVTLRLLISYYCLRIINEADKNGLNNYGIDIFPEISLLLEEIETSPNLVFQEDYVQGLTQLQTYYKQKGRQ